VRLLSAVEVRARVRVPRSTWYKLRARGQFPAPLKVGASRLALWREDDIHAWLKQNPPAPPKPARIY
jgi:prophage regulatory protein